MHQTSPRPGDKEAAEVDGNLGHGSESVEINLLTCWAVGSTRADILAV
jgi:hypothetical protein